MGVSEVREMIAGEDTGERDVGPSLRVLGEIKFDGVSWVMSSQQLSLFSFLVCTGPANRRTIVEALWGGQRISDQRVSNLLAEVRAIVGRRHFPDLVDGRYKVVGVATDLQRFQRDVEAICEFGRQHPVLDELAGAAIEVRSVRAVSAICGVPFTIPSPRYWPWLDDHAGLISTTEELVASGVLALAELLRTAGRVGAAVTVLERGVVACPLDEELTVTLVRSYRAQGRLRHAQRLVVGWEARIRRLGCGEPSAGPRNGLAPTVTVGVTPNRRAEQ